MEQGSQGSSAHGSHQSLYSSDPSLAHHGLLDGAGMGGAGIGGVSGAGSATSVFEFEPPPSYLQHVQKHQQHRSSATSVHSARSGVHSGINCGMNGGVNGLDAAYLPPPPHPPPMTDIPGMMAAGTVAAQTVPPLSPISESSSGMGNNLSGPNTRSVSVSNESVAGDSGVFEAATHSHKRPSDIDALFESTLESAQIQIQLR
jgi:hypothetical protein